MHARLADAVVLAHFLFIAFAVTGSLLLVRWPRLIWVHLPAAAWAALVELFGWVCPLTPLERRLRALAGEAATEGDFIARHLLPLIYPEELTRELQIALGLGVLLFNLAIYAWLWRRRR